MARILVTGSNGFIGTHLCEELARPDTHDIFGCDWTYDGLFYQEPGRDLRRPGIFQGALEQVQPDFVVHLAAQVGRLLGEEDLIHTITSNAQMTALVAHACGKAGVRLCYASTSEVYGDNGKQICHEYEGPWGLPHNLYGLTKGWGEDVCELYAPDGLIVVRLSMPAGPGAPPGRGRRALDNMLWQAHHRMPITVHKDAERSWCHVRETVNGIRMILESGEIGAFNVGRDDQPVSMLRVAEMACEMTGASKDLIEVVDPPARQTVVKRLSTARLRALGWEPKIDLKQIMEETLEWVTQFDRDGERIAA